LLISGKAGLCKCTKRSLPATAFGAAFIDKPKPETFAEGEAKGTAQIFDKEYLGQLSNTDMLTETATEYASTGPDG
jgi:hypothetical protein